MRMITSILVALTFMWVGVNDTLAQGLHFGVKGGVLGNKASVSGVRDNIREESLTGFQVAPCCSTRPVFMVLPLTFHSCMPREVLS